MTAWSAASRGAGESHFAWTDLVSNHTVFRNQEDYRALLRGTALPVPTFSSFVHEATHHWCFISPVGTALSLLYLSVAKRALQWVTTGDESRTHEALDDLRAFDIAVSWLRPLHEGLALFAEYDARPSRSSSLLSPPMEASLRHVFDLSKRLASSPRPDGQSVLYEIEDEITAWRLSRATIERKSELLLQPIGIRGGGYLLGYLTVKQLWRSSARFYPALAESDVFLMFLRRMVFGDYGLVAEILDRSRPAHERGLRFAQRVYDRLMAIRLMVFDDELPWSELEKLITPPVMTDGADRTDVADEAFAGLDNERDVRRGIDLRKSYLREVGEWFDLGEQGLPFPPDYFYNVQRERYLMWLGGVMGRWSSTGPRAGRVLVDGETVLDDITLGHASDVGLDEVSLDIYVDLYAGYQLTTIGARDRGVFAVGFVQRASKDPPAALMKLRLDRDQVARMTKIVHDAIRGFIDNTNYTESLAQFWAESAGDLLEETYLGFAVDSDDDARQALRHGLAGVLQNDGDLVRNVAAISIAASAELTCDGLLSMSSGLPLDPSNTLARIATLWRSDLPLAEVGEDGFLRSAF